MGDNTVTGLEDRVKALRAMRSTVYKKSLSWSERFDLANEIYNTLMIDWAIETLTGPMTTGSGALTLQIERARLELEWLAPKCDSQGKKGNISIGFELQGIENPPIDA